MYLLDTCTLLWWTLDRSKLSKKSLAAIREVSEDSLSISSISLWEIAVKVNRKTLSLGVKFEQFYENLRDSQIVFHDVDDEIWVKNAFLKWDHRDPVDRTIVSTALIYDLTVLTSDREIRKFYDRTIW